MVQLTLTVGACELGYTGAGIPAGRNVRAGGAIHTWGRCTSLI